MCDGHLSVICDRYVVFAKVTYRASLTHQNAKDARMKCLSTEEKSTAQLLKLWDRFMLISGHELWSLLKTLI
jgi:hypothetical protein